MAAAAVQGVRRVRHVRLRAENPAAAQRGLLLLEDALHTAALPGAGGRLLIVRRLEVGRIDPRGGPNSAALAVEARLRAAALYAVAADRPGFEHAAAHAGAVTFADAVAPCAALALRLATGGAPDAWYWPLAVAGWRAGLPRAEGLRRVIACAATLLPQGAGARRVAAVLARAGAIGALLDALEPADGASLLQAHGLAPATFAPAGARTQPAPGAPYTPAPALPGYWRTALAAAIAQWGAHDPRSGWLALAAVGEAAPALLLAPAAAVQAAQHALAQAAAPRHRAAMQPGTRATNQSASSSVRQPERQPGAPLSTGDRDAAGADTRGAEPFDLSTPGAETASAEGHSGGAPTAGGGLLFVVPVLEALGFAAWLGGRPALAAARLPERLLLLLGRNAGLPPDDPLLAWLAGEVEGAAQAEGADAACRLWRAALRGWLARRAHTSLRALTLRPARAAVTPTHVQITFALDQADLRVRRLGLDVDPGWVAWLGRVVTYHYGDGVAE